MITPLKLWMYTQAAISLSRSRNGAQRARRKTGQHQNLVVSYWIYLSDKATAAGNPVYISGTNDRRGKERTASIAADAVRYARAYTGAIWPFMAETSSQSAKLV